MRKLKNMIALTVALVFVVGCSGPAGPSTEAKSTKSNAEATPTSVAPAKTAPAKTAPGKEVPVKAAPAKPASEKKDAPKPQPKLEMKSLNKWDFATLDKSKLGWSFPGTLNALQKSDKGIAIEMTKSAPCLYGGMLQVDASQVNAIRMDVSVVKVEGKKETPQPFNGLRLVWAREGVDGAKPEEFWTTGFDRGKRSVTFEATDAATPNLVLAKLLGHPAWNGKIDKLFVDVIFDKPIPLKSKGKYRVYVKSMEFLQ